MKSFCLAASVFALGALCASVPAHASDYVLKVSHGVTTDSPLHRTLEQFERRVETESNGAIDVRLFPSGQLAAVRESVEGAQSGAIEVVAATGGVLAGFAPA